MPSAARKMALDTGTSAEIELLRRENTNLQRLVDARNAREQRPRAPESPGYETRHTRQPSPDRDLGMDRDD